MKQKPCTRMDGPLVQGFFIKERSGMSDSLFKLEKVGFQAKVLLRSLKIKRALSELQIS
ncbi:hypothetical protein SAMN04487821_12755 [Enterococcus malodoratus]|nr:hypothetical protein SAMN04487821_12755 [Enterococcus malodoratus]